MTVYNQNIFNAPEEFAKAIQLHGSKIICEKNGTWRIEGCVAWKVHRLFCQNDKRLLRIAQAASACLDSAEADPGKNKINKAAYLSVAHEIKEKLKGNKNREIKEMVGLISWKEIALRVRTEYTQEIDQKQKFDQEMEEKLKEMALKWKESQANFVDVADVKTGVALTEKNKERLRKAACFPDFLEFIEKNKGFQEIFFKWTIRDNVDPEILFLFPALYQPVKNGYLSERLGKLADQHIMRVSYEGGTVKPEMAFDLENGKMQYVSLCSLVDPQKNGVKDQTEKVTLKAGYRLSLKQVFKEFSVKDTEAGKVEMLRGGIANWNSHQMGYWNPKSKKTIRISLGGKSWWNQLPDLEVVSKEKLETRYGLNLKPNQWVAFARATRKSPNIDIDKVHGYFGVAIPKEDGNYRLLDFGKFPTKCPNKPIGYAQILLDTVEAVVAYPDQNSYFAHRTQAAVPYVLDQEEGLEIMTFLAGFIDKSRKGNLVFQLVGENCAHLPVTLLESIKKPVENLYTGSFFEDSEPSDPVVRAIFRFVRFAAPLSKNDPEGGCIHRILQAVRRVWRRVLVNFICFIFGCFLFGHWRGRFVDSEKDSLLPVTYKSVIRGPFAETGGDIHLPAKLHTNIKEKKALNGIITCGHGGDS